MSSRGASGTATVAAPSRAGGTMTRFLLVWFGQLVSLIGSSVSGFAIGVWVYQRSGSATQFGLISVCIKLPVILLSPIAGAVVDRADRRWVLIGCNVGGMLVTLVMALLYFAGRLEVWHIYIAMAFASSLTAFQWPAYMAATTLLVPKRHLGRAGGLTNLSDAVAQILSPLLGGLLVVAVTLSGVFIIDFFTFLFAIVTLLLIRIPRPARDGTEESKRRSLWHDSAYGWGYVRARPGLFALLSFFALTNFMSGFPGVLITPLVLAFAPPGALGTVLSVGGAGLLAGSMLMSVWGGPKRRIHGVLVFQLVSGLCFVLAGLRPSAATVAAACFVYFFCFPIINGSSQVIWQTKVPPGVQGRVFAVRRMIAWSSLPVAYLVAGPLADYVFEPLLADARSPLAETLGAIVGVGQGRGIGLLFIILGLLTVLSVCCAYLYPRLRYLEDELTDAIPDAGAPEPVAAGT